MQILVRDIFISLIIVSSIVFINAKKLNKKICSISNIGIIFFSLIIVIIFSLTGISPVSGFHLDIRVEEISFIPFLGINRMLQNGINHHTIINIVGNIIMFMPVGFLIPLLWSKFESFKNLVMCGFGISLFIEFIQLFLIRGTDVDDLILNTMGTILGYLVYIILKKLFPTFIEKIIIESKAIESKMLFLMCILVPYLVIVIAGFYDRYILY